MNAKNLNPSAHRLTWGLIVFGSLLYIGIRLLPSPFLIHAHQIETGPAPTAVQSILAGPFKGIAADFNILAVFTVYDQIKHAPLDETQQQLAWQQLSSYLYRAQSLDPWFMDTYRLSIGLLGFSKGYAADAVQLLEMGSSYISQDWRLPFFAGFIAYDRLQDEGKAFKYMQESIKRPNVPPLAIGLASRFLQKDKGEEASMLFLEYMLATMPRGYHGPIKRRLDELKTNTYVKGNKK